MVVRLLGWTRRAWDTGFEVGSSVVDAICVFWEALRGR